MNKVKYIRIQQQDNLYSGNVPISANAENVILVNGNNLQDIFDNYVVDEEGTIVTNFENFKNLIASLYASIANEYSSGNTYNVNDYVIHNNYLYKCISTIDEGEAWNANHWTLVNIGDQLFQAKGGLIFDSTPTLNSLNPVTSHGIKIYVGQELLNNIDDSLSTEAMAADAAATGQAIQTLQNQLSQSYVVIATPETGYTASKTYYLNDYIMINGVLYRVTSVIPQGGTISPRNNCIATTVGNELLNLKNYIDQYDIGSAEGREMTYAEYYALSDAQKMDGTVRFLTDINNIPSANEENF